MDLKALMQKLETINKTEILTESEKKETTWTDKSGKKHPATQVKGDKYTGKEADAGEPGRKSDEDGPKSKYKKYPVPDKEIDEGFTSAIAQALAEEFGYDLDERITINPDGTTSGGIAPAPAAATPNPWANDPAKSAAWAALTPQDQKWLGSADPTDPYILARAPNKGKPAAPAAATSAATPAPAAAPSSGAATKPAAADPAVAATREKFKALMDKLEKTGGVSGAAPVKEDPNEGNAFSGALNAAKDAGEDEFKVDGDTYSVKESVTYQDDQTLLAIKNIRF